MKKEIESLPEKADKVIKARKTVGELSEIFSGDPAENEETFYIKRLRVINAAHIYLIEKLSIKEEQRAGNASLKIAFGFLFGMLFGAIMTNMPNIRKAFNL